MRMPLLVPRKALAVPDCPCEDNYFPLVGTEHTPLSVSLFPGHPTCVRSGAYLCLSGGISLPASGHTFARNACC